MSHQRRRALFIYPYSGNTAHIRRENFMCGVRTIHTRILENPHEDFIKSTRGFEEVDRCRTKPTCYMGITTS